MKRLVMLALLAACGPSRATYARYPGAPAAFDRTSADAKALEIADAMFTAAGGPGNWDKAKQLRWHQTLTADGKTVIAGEIVWDRWNGRHLGRLASEQGTLVVGYEQYGDFEMGYAESGERGEKKQNFDSETRTRYIGTLKERFNTDTGVMALPLLVFEPGAKLEYVGPVKDDAGNETADDLKITFADPARAGIEFHAIVDRTSHLPQRIETIKAGAREKIAWILKDWTTAGGLKFAASRVNAGYAGETVTIKDVKVGAPDDELFIAPISH